MPPGRKFDFQLGGKGYLLARPGKGLARAWSRSGLPDTPSIEQPRVAGEFGGLPAQVEYPEVWNDWSGGFGYAYRHPKDENSYFGFLANANTYHWSENFDARFSRQLIHCQKLQSFGNSTTQTKFLMDAPFPSGNILSSSVLALIYDTNVPAHQVYIMEPTGSTNIANTYAGPTVGDDGFQAATYGSYYYIPDGSLSTFTILPLEGGTATKSAAGNSAAGFVVAGNRLWKAFGPDRKHVYQLQSVADTASSVTLAAASWSATLNIGDDHTSIQSMIALNDELFIGKPEGLFAGDQSGTFLNVIPDVASQVHEDNCRDVTIYDGQVVTPAISGLYAFHPSGATAITRQIGPTIHSNKSPINGRFRCVRSLGGWIYGGYFTGSASYVLAGNAPFSSTADPVWHVLQKMPRGEVSRIHFDGVTHNSANQRISTRMWVSVEATAYFWTSDNALYVTPVPLMNQNPLLPQELGFTPNFANSARMDLGSTDGRAPTTPKSYRSCEVWADNLDGSQRWGLIYYTIDSGTRTLLGTVNTSPRSVLFFPHTDGSFASGQSIELSLESYIASGSEATTPVYRSIVLRQTQLPRSVDVITAVVDVGDHLADRQGAQMRPGQMQLQELRGLIATGPVQLVDLTGASWWAKVLAPVQEQESWQDDISNPSVLATVKMSVMVYSGS